jgi:hypothetical protein
VITHIFTNKLDHKNKKKKYNEINNLKKWIKYSYI